MQTLVIDTNGIVKKLEQRGFSRTQAEGITEALKELDISMLATKSDLKDLELRLVKWIAGMLLAQGALIVALIKYCTYPATGGGAGRVAGAGAGRCRCRWVSAF